MPLLSLLININVFLLNKVLIYLFKKKNVLKPFRENTHLDIKKSV